MITLVHFELLAVNGKRRGGGRELKIKQFIDFLCLRLIVLQSRPAITPDYDPSIGNTQTTCSDSLSPCDLYILMGHENT